MRIPTVLLVAFVLAGCSSVTLRDVDFSWPVESVLTVDRKGAVEDPQRGITANLTPLSMEEFQDSVTVRGMKVHMIRSHEGYYFFTAPRFKCVYVFAPGERELTLKSAIEVAPQGLREPALNQRPPHVELIDPSLAAPLRLTNDGILQGGQQ